MSATPARRRFPAVEPASARPTLRVLSECEHCKGQVTEVRDRAGKPVRFDAGPDGRAIRDPAGEWWAAKIRGQWCVVRPQPGEDPPGDDRAVRYAEHRCGGTAAVGALSGLGVVTVEATVEAVDLVTGNPAGVDPAAVRRPPGRGQGLSGPECPDRRLLVQFPAEGKPRVRMCIRCGRITSRDDGDDLPWCGGLFRAVHGWGPTGV